MSGICRPYPPAVRAFGKELRRFADEPQQYDLLRQIHADGWTEGGCGGFAAGLKAWLGRHGALYAIRRKARGNRRRYLDHMVVKVGPYYLDGDGAHTAKQLIAANLRWYRNVYEAHMPVSAFAIRPARARDMDRPDINACPVGVRATLASRLVDRFGEDPRPYICPSKP